MAKKYTRKLKGGEVDINAVKSTIIQLKDDVIRISKDVEELGKNLELNKTENIIQDNQQSQTDENVVQNNNNIDANKEQMQKNLQNYAKIIKETGDTYNAITKDAKDLLLQNMVTNKDLLEKEGITEEWLNNMPTQEDINLYENLRNDIKNKIISIEAYLKQYCYTDGVFKKNEPVCANKDNTLRAFENTLHKNESNENMNNKVSSLQNLQQNISGYIAKNKLKVGGRKTKKTQKKSRKNNKSRK